MPDNDDRRERLAQLFLELAREGQPDPGELAAYADDPDSLTAEARIALEARMTEPRVADQLRVLEGFDPAVAAAEEEPEPVRPTLAPAPAERRSWWAALLSPGPLMGIAAGAAAALLTVVLLPTAGPGPLPKGVSVARAPAAADVLSEAPPQSSSAAPSGVAPRPKPPEIDPALVAALEPRPRPAEGSAARPSPAELPPEWSEPEPSLLADESGEAPMLVASAIDYVEPGNLIERPWQGSYRSIVGDSSAKPVGLQVRALVPQHVASASSATPSLFWHLSEAPQPGWQFIFEIRESGGLEPRAEYAIPAPRAAGVQRLRLGNLAIQLRSGVEYQWSVNVVRDAADPGRDVSADGYVQRAPVSAAARQRLGRGLLQNASVFAAEGLWYDALAAVADELERTGGGAPAREAYRRLLGDVGLIELATTLPADSR